MFTSDRNEYNSLPILDPSGSWRQENIGWYAESLRNVDMYNYKDHVLDLPSIDNARQLGGYVMPNGKKIKQNMLLRSGSLSNLSGDEKAKLENIYRLKEVVDLRSNESFERGNNPDIIPNGANYHFAPAMDVFHIYDQETLMDMQKALAILQKMLHWKT